jgi:hypothetical protein
MAIDATQTTGGPMTAHDEPTLIPWREAQQLAGWSEATMERRVREGAVRVFRDGRDRRRFLVPVEDIVRATRPVPVPRDRVPA